MPGNNADARICPIVSRTDATKKGGWRLNANLPFKHYQTLRSERQRLYRLHAGKRTSLL